MSGIGITGLGVASSALDFATGGTTTSGTLSDFRLLVVGLHRHDRRRPVGVIGSNTGRSAGLAFSSAGLAGVSADFAGSGGRAMSMSNSAPLAGVSGAGVSLPFGGDVGLTVKLGSGAGSLAGSVLSPRGGGEHGQPADPDGQRAGQDLPAIQGHGFSAPGSVRGRGVPMRTGEIPPPRSPVCANSPGPDGSQVESPDTSP